MSLPAPTAHRVSAKTAIERVIAVAAVERIGTAVAIDGVGKLVAAEGQSGRTSIGPQVFDLLTRRSV